MSRLADRMPPHSAQTEREVLSAILIDPAKIHEVRAFLRDDHFFSDPYQCVYRSMLALADRGAPLDALTLLEELDRRGDMVRAGGVDGMATIQQAAPSAANAVYHARMVLELATVRGIIAACSEVIDTAYKKTHTCDDLIEMAEKRLIALADPGTSESLRALASYGPAVLARFDRRIARANGQTPPGQGGLRTGLSQIDEMIDGLHPGMVYLVAARPSQGKTSLGLNLCETAVLDQGARCLFVSLEMRGIEIAERSLISQSRVAGLKLKIGSGLDAEEMGRLGAALKRLEEAGDRFTLFDPPTATISQIAAAARRMAMRGGLDLLLLDYLGQVEPDKESRKENRQEVVAKISRRVKGLARELNLPVVLLAQLNRDSEKRADPRPRMSDIRESGSVEADADVIILLHRPAEKPQIAELDIAKNRNGPTGRFEVAWSGSLMRFENPYDSEANNKPF